MQFVDTPVYVIPSPQQSATIESLTLRFTVSDITFEIHRLAKVTQANLVAVVDSESTAKITQADLVAVADVNVDAKITQANLVVPVILAVDGLITQANLVVVAVPGPTRRPSLIVNEY